jgi:hypothetical protein
MHTGHKTIRGASKFKENMSYVTKDNTLLRIPGTSPETVAILSYWGGMVHKQYTNAEIVELSEQFSASHLKGEDISPVYLSLTLSYPLGMVALIGCAAAGWKAYIPSTYNLADITSGLQT